MKNSILGLAKRVNDTARESDIVLTVDEVADVVNSLHKVIDATIHDRISGTLVMREVKAAKTSSEKWSIIMRNVKF